MCERASREGERERESARQGGEENRGQLAALLKCSRRLGGKEDEMSVGEGEETKGDHIVVLVQRKKEGRKGSTRKQ